MRRMRPTAQNMPEDEYVHQTMARQVRIYPGRVSMGKKMPTREVSTKGRRQYPSTEAERGKVRLDWDLR